MHINEVTKINSIRELQPLIAKAELKITFFAGRKISLPGYDGEISLEELVEHVEVIITKYFDGKNFTYSEEEQIAGDDMAVDIDALFSKSRTLIQSDDTSCFTKICFWFIEVIPYIFCYMTIENRWNYDIGELSLAFSNDIPTRPKILPRASIFS